MSERNFPPAHFNILPFISNVALNWHFTLSKEHKKGIVISDLRNTCFLRIVADKRTTKN
jgi:hypothetical protein